MFYYLSPLLAKEMFSIRPGRSENSIELIERKFVLLFAKDRHRPRGYRSPGPGECVVPTSFPGSLPGNEAGVVVQSTTKVLGIPGSD